ncbi:MAG: hypothetical protein HC800_15180 [Phormidesmis sp. RL_2_1]|nr:hypothetical protein [Phormidesmis sp. RL_2_1]
MTQQLNIIVFSKDRACQLELLLRSMMIFFESIDNCTTHILYAGSTPDYRDAYELVKARYPRFTYTCENEHELSFKEHTLNLLQEKTPYVVFLVDDMVFRRPFSLSNISFEKFQESPEVACLSLRLSPHIDYSYVFDTHSPPPPLDQDLKWLWRRVPMNDDWGVVMSLDGHIYRTAEILPLVESADDFLNPCYLEGHLVSSPLNHPKMICLAESAVLTIPINQVQTTHQHRHGRLLSAESLNKSFLDGYLVSLSQILDVSNRSVHHPLEFTLFKPCLTNDCAPKPALSVNIQLNNFSELDLIKQLEHLSCQTQAISSINLNISLEGGENDAKMLRIADAFANVYEHLEIEISHSQSNAETLDANMIAFKHSEHLHSEYLHSEHLYVEIERYQKLISDTLASFVHFFGNPDDVKNEQAIFFFFKWQEALYDYQRLKTDHKMLENAAEKFRQDLKGMKIELDRERQGINAQEVERLKNEIVAMESSKFWKLRKAWMQIKNTF